MENIADINIMLVMSSGPIGSIRRKNRIPNSYSKYSDLGRSLGIVIGIIESF